MSAPEKTVPRIALGERPTVSDGGTAGIAEHMTTHTPVTLTAEAAFIRDISQLIAAQTDYSPARATRILGRYVEWARKVRGLPLGDLLLFDQETIDLCIRDAVKRRQLSKSSVATYRSLLLRASEILLPDGDKTQARGVGQRSQLQPYTGAEVDRFQPWMLGQRTDNLRRKAIALTCLGLGAGLRAGEILRLRRVHVIDDGDITLTVPNDDQMREVPMLTRWAPAFRHLIEDLDEDDFVFGRPQRAINPNSISEFVQTASGSLKPSTYRMRSTYIVGRLAARVDLPTLLAATGLERLEKLAEYLPWLPPAPDGAFDLLRQEVEL